MHRMTFSVTNHEIRLIQQPEAVLHILNDNVNLSAGKGKNTFLHTRLGFILSFQTAPTPSPLLPFDKLATIKAMTMGLGG